MGVHRVKKRLFCIVAIVVAIIACVTLFVACTEETEETETPTESSNTTINNGKFNIFYEKEYVCALVLSENATEDEKTIVTDFKAELGRLTKKQIKVINEGQITDEYQTLILFGNTSLQESKDAKASLGEREAIAKVVGNKLVISYDTLSSLRGIAEKILEELAKCEEGSLNLSLEYKNTYKALPEIEDLLGYVDGTVKEIDCGEQTTMHYVTGSSLDAFDTYCSALEEAEFKKTFDREEKDNVFRTFLAENHYVHAYYTKYNEEIRIITGPIEALAEQDYSTNLEEKYTPYIASIPQPDDGMGYIFRLPDGRFIISDAGYKGDDRVYKALTDLQKRDGDTGDIVIAAWFMSHPHSDHYPALLDFVKSHGRDKNIKLERIIHNYVEASMYNIDGTAGVDTSGKSVEEFYETLKKYAADVPIIKAHTGQTMNFGSVDIEIMYTVEDMIPGKINNTNGTSLVFRMILDGEDGAQSVMMLADTYVDSANIMIKMWGDYLKSDVMQMAHHAIWPANEALYHQIKAETIIYPAAYKNLKKYLNEKIEGSDNTKIVNATALSYAKDIYVMCERFEVLELPHKIVNNKEAMLQTIKNS